MSWDIAAELNKSEKINMFRLDQIEAEMDERDDADFESLFR